MIFPPGLSTRDAAWAICWPHQIKTPIRRRTSSSIHLAPTYDFAKALDAVWLNANSPDPLVYVRAGAGATDLCRYHLLLPRASRAATHRRLTVRYSHLFRFKL